MLSERKVNNNVVADRSTPFGTCSIPTVFYDGSCPVCSKEINAIKNASDDSISFVDVHSISEHPEKEKATLLRDLHIKGDNNRWLVGLDANLYMWESLKDSTHTYARLFPLLAKIVKRPIVYWFAKMAYRFWADRRYQKLYGKH